MAQLALGCIGKSDALYHDVEHTMLVTLAGHEILQGRAVHSPVPAEEYAHFIIACLMHDIGFVRGILEGDGQDGEVIDSSGRKITLPRGASDAALFQYHVIQLGHDSADRWNGFLISADITSEERTGQSYTSGVEI